MVAEGAHRKNIARAGGCGMNTPEQKPPPRITIVELKPLNNGSALRAFADLQIGPMVVKKARYVRQDGQRGFVTAPQEEWTDNSGKKHYNPLVIWPREWGDAITEAVTQALEDHPEGIKQVGGNSAFSQAVRENAGLSGGPRR